VKHVYLKSNKQDMNENALSILMKLRVQNHFKELTACVLTEQSKLRIPPTVYFPKRWLPTESKYCYEFQIIYKNVEEDKSHTFS
jgi:hypothetical protein